MSTKKAVAILAALGLLAVASCKKKATEQECLAACQKKLSLTKPEKPKESPTAKIEKDFDQKIKLQQNQRAAELQKLDQELQQKLKEVKKEEEQAKLKQEYDKKKQEVTQKYEKAIKDLQQKKKEALDKAKKQAEAEAKAKREKFLKECKEECLKKRFTKSKVDCQLQAKTLDEFNKCK